MQRTFLIDGLVHNVHFRKSVESYASQFGCSVLAVNADDYTVVVTLEGQYSEIDEVIRRCLYSFSRSNASVVAAREVT